MEPQNLIYDRSFQDVQRVAELSRKISAGSASAEEVQEWFSAKGALNYEDLNRIESWTEFLSNQLKSYGYNAPITKRAERVYINATTAKRLPEEYQEVAWIESHGGEYIDTGFNPNQDTRVEMDVQSVGINTDDTGQSFFGARNGSSYRFFTFWHRTNLAYYIYYNNTSSSVASDRITDRMKVVMDKNKLSIGDVVSVEVGFASFECLQSLYLFATNLDGAADYFGVNRVYSCQIYDNETLVRNMVPCYRKADGAKGMYCLVTQKFFVNLGAGEFAIGPNTIFNEEVRYCDWRVWDIPKIEEINRIRDNINNLRDGFYRLSDWREIAYKDNLNIEDVNTLEWDIQTIYNWLKLMVLNFNFSGEMYAGEA